MSQIVEIQLYECAAPVIHERAFSCFEEGSFYKVREANKTFLYPTERVRKITIESRESYYG